VHSMSDMMIPNEVVKVGTLTWRMFEVPLVEEVHPNIDPILFVKSINGISQSISTLIHIICDNV
jgi:hypothetical protein